MKWEWMGLGEALDDVEIRAAGRGTVAVASFPSPEREPGRRNEDAFGVFVIDDDTLVLAVADGCGGQPRGGDAADLAIRSLSAALREHDDGEQLRTAILNGFEAAHHAILDLAAGAATTLVVAQVHEGRMRTYHVGDSGLLLVGNRGRIGHQTMAHSPVGYALESGLIDERDALEHEDRHLVSNQLGARDMRIEVGPAVPMHARDTLLLASDGLFDNLRHEEIVNGIRKGKLLPAARAMRTRSRERMHGGEEGAPQKPDDFTFVLFRPEPR